MHTSSLLLSSELLSADSASPIRSSSITLRFAIVCSIGSLLENAIAEFRGGTSRVKLPLGLCASVFSLTQSIRAQPFGLCISDAIVEILWLEIQYYSGVVVSN